RDGQSICTNALASDCLPTPLIEGIEAKITRYVRIPSHRGARSPRLLGQSTENLSHHLKMDYGTESSLNPRGSCGFQTFLLGVLTCASQLVCFSLSPPVSLGFLLACLNLSQLVSFCISCSASHFFPQGHTKTNLYILDGHWNDKKAIGFGTEIGDRSQFKKIFAKDPLINNAMSPFSKTGSDTLRALTTNFHSSSAHKRVATLAVFYHISEKPDPFIMEQFQILFHGRLLLHEGDLLGHIADVHRWLSPDQK
ncbi:hypothetical protein PTTG_12415, partial [Puccinia triticina 1-1 BBBD Race 1]